MQKNECLMFSLMRGWQLQTLGVSAHSLLTAVAQEVTGST